MSSASQIAIYARYSSDLQNPSSVDDQIRLCRSLVSDLGHDASQALIYSDAAISGATMARPGLFRLLEDAKRGRFKILVAEGLDRISRSMKDIAGFYEIFGYHEIEIITAHEGRISELHIGLKGTMNALYLKDLKDKVRRGMFSRAAAGFAVAPCPYGYRSIRGLWDEESGRPIHGVREICEEEAKIVRRIFEEYANGRSPLQIARDLNDDGILSRNGNLWHSRSIRGSENKGDGILLNEAYIGKLVYGRTKSARDPATGRQKYIVQPAEKWIRVDMPDWRIIDDELWAAARRVRIVRTVKKPMKSESEEKFGRRLLTSHNQHALTGWVRCGVCGETKSLANNSRYVCQGNRYGNSCKNSRGVKEGILLERTFETLLRRIHQGPDFRPVFLPYLETALATRDSLTTKEKNILSQIERFLDAIGDGLDEGLATARISKLQKDLEKIRRELKHQVNPDLPDEKTIRQTLALEIKEREESATVLELRFMFTMLLQKITLTPIPNKSQGETIKIELREKGWAEFWAFLRVS